MATVTVQYEGVERPIASVTLVLSYREAIELTKALAKEKMGNPTQSIYDALTDVKIY